MICSGAVTLSKDGKHLAVARRYVHQVYDIDSGVVARTFKHKLGLAIDSAPVTFAHGDMALLGAYDAGVVRLWNLPGQAKMQTLCCDTGKCSRLNTLVSDV